MINEAQGIHPELSAVLDANAQAKQKHTAMSKVFRSLLKAGKETGLQDNKPKKGSSRAVYFPSEPDDITIDGTPTKMRAVLKVAFPGSLDKYNHSGLLLGEHQNIEEADHYTSSNYGVLHQQDDGTFKYNPDGILAPVTHAHPEGHYLHMAEITPLTAAKFKELTKTEEFPRGISHKDFKEACEHEYATANGRKYYGGVSEERLEKIKEHPYVNTTIQFCLETGAHPADFGVRNMGVWTHPVTGKEHPVLADYGFKGGVVREYEKARRRQVEEARERRNMRW